MSPGRPTLEFRLLGPFEVRTGQDGDAVAVGPPKNRVLLAALLLQVGRPVSVWDLAEAIWGDAQPADPRRAVQLYVSRLRKVFGRFDADHLIRTYEDAYEIDVRPEQVDLRRFEQSLARAARAVQDDDLDGEADALTEALAEWRGEPLAEIPSESLQREVAPVLRERRLQALTQHFDLALRRGRSTEIVSELSVLAAEHPLRERLWEQLIAALHESGRRTDALAAYHTLRDALIDELGIEPSEDLQSWHAKILAGRPLSTGGSSSALPTVPRQLPSDLPTFTGRVEDLAKLDALVDDRIHSKTTITVISGTAGVGKTALAVRWARRVVDRFPDGQLWVNLRGYDPGQALTPEQALNRFLRALGVSDAEIPLDLDDRAGLYRSLMDGRRMLIVLDNAGDLVQVRPLLPGAPGSLVVVTSRNQLSELVVDGARPLVLDLLTRDEARDLLIARLGADRACKERNATEEIVDLCARLPLALAIVAARAATHPEFGLDVLSAELRGARGSLDAFAGLERVSGVRAAFSSSYSALGEQAARLFRLLGLHPGPDIAAAGAANLAGVPLSQIRRPLLELCNAHLLTEHTPGRYSFHDLLRAYATELTHSQDTADDRRRARYRIMDHYVLTAQKAATLMRGWEAPPATSSSQPGVTIDDVNDHREALAWCSAEHHVLLAVIQQAADVGFSTHAWLLAWTIADYLYRRGHWHDWARVEQIALDHADRHGKRADRSRAHRELARVLIKLGNVDRAQTHSTRALELSDRRSDPIGFAMCHRIFGQLLEARELHREALGHERQALEAFQAIGHRTGTARTLNAIGWTYALIGDNRQALTYCEQAMRLIRDQGDLIGHAATCDSLGYVYHQFGRHRDAAACYQRSLELFQEIGDRHKESDSLMHLGDTHLAAGDFDAARTAWQQATRVLIEMGNHTLEVLRSTPEALRSTPEALQSRLSDLERLEDACGPGHHN